MLLTLLVACGGGSSGPGGGVAEAAVAAQVIPELLPETTPITVNAAVGSVTRSVDVASDRAVKSIARTTKDTIHEGDLQRSGCSFVYLSVLGGSCFVRHRRITAVTSL